MSALDLFQLTYKIYKIIYTTQTPAFVHVIQCNIILKYARTRDKSWVCLHDLHVCSYHAYIKTRTFLDPNTLGTKSTVSLSVLRAHCTHSMLKKDVDGIHMYMYMYHRMGSATVTILVQICKELIIIKVIQLSL